MIIDLLPESTTFVNIIPGEEVLLNCSESSFITIENVRVQNTGRCDGIQTECNLNSNDYDLMKALCEGSSSCTVNGSLLTFACLQDDLHFDLSYTCQLQGKYR